MSDRYKIDIEPDKTLLLERPCLSVTIWDNETSKYVALGELTRRQDQDAARRLAAKLITEWERQQSTVTI